MTGQNHFHEEQNDGVKTFYGQNMNICYIFYTILTSAWLLLGTIKWRGLDFLGKKWRGCHFFREKMTRPKLFPGFKVSNLTLCKPINFGPAIRGIAGCQGFYFLEFSFVLQNLRIRAPTIQYLPYKVSLFLSSATAIGCRTTQIILSHA